MRDMQAQRRPEDVMGDEFFPPWTAWGCRRVVTDDGVNFMASTGWVSSPAPWEAP